MTTATQSAPTLSPPWWILYSKIRESIGASPHVHVGPMQQSGSTYTINIFADIPQRAMALGSIVRPEFQFGNITVKVNVFPLAQTPEASSSSSADPIQNLVNALNLALQNNLYFSQAFAPGHHLPTIGQVVAVFKPMVIQFYEDNISDFYSNFNGVAASVFQDVLCQQCNGATLSVTTQPISQPS